MSTSRHLVTEPAIRLKVTIRQTRCSEDGSSKHNTTKEMSSRKNDATLVVAFDAYGTLLSTYSRADGLGSPSGPDGVQAMATKWRTYQKQYTSACT